MADPTPSDDGTRAMPSGSGPKPHPAAGSVELPVKIGRYEVRDLLGEGAFGRVFLAFDPRLNRPVAIKLPKPEGFTDDMRERFVREAWATATIHHPNVCPVYDVGDEGDLPYIVMHYQPGGTLGGHLDKWKALPPQQAVALAQKLALGVAAAHEKGVIHRDLKPANILFDPARHLALITDFGLARIGGQAGSTSVGAVFGTPLYMSPEQARGETDAVGPHSDIYSLGVILYRMLTGTVPFDGNVYDVLIKHNQEAPTPPSVARRGLDKRLDALVLKAMAKKPADRYPSAKAFADALAEYARSADTVAGGWSKATLMDPVPPSSAAVPAVPAPPVPPLAPKPAGKSNPPAPLKPAGKSEPPAPPKVAGKSAPPVVPPRAPTVPLPARPVPNPPSGAAQRAALDPPDDGAFRQKVLLAGGGLLLVLMAVATVAILATSKTPPPVEKVEPAPTPPAPTPPPTPTPKTDPAPVEKKDPVPPKKRPLPVNNFAGHEYSAAAERRAAEWALAQGAEVSVAPRGSNTPRPVANPGELPVGEFAVSRVVFRNKPGLTDATLAANLAGLSGPLEAGFHDCGQVGNETVAALAGVPELNVLTLVNAFAVTDEAAQALAGHPKLTELDLNSTGVTKAGIKHVATLTKLTRLSVRAKDTDEWLPDLAPLTGLTRLELLANNAGHLTARGLAALKPFRKLKRLSLFGLNVKDDWVKLILDAGPWPDLDELELRDSSIEGPGLVHLKDFPRVDWVSLSGSRVRDAGLEHVAAAPKVQFVYLNNTTVGDDGLKALARSKSLLQLELQNNKRITDRGLGELAALKTLAVLELTNTDITDAGAKALAGCAGLKKVTLTGTAVSTRGVEELKKALPNCAVIHADAKAPVFDPRKLAGKWERAGDPTKKNYYWEFADGKLTMGFLDTKGGTPRPYVVKDDQLIVDGIKDGAKLTYTITKLTDDELEVLQGTTKTAVTYKKVPSKP